MKPIQVTIGDPQGIDIERLKTLLEHWTGRRVIQGNGRNGIPIGMLVLEERETP